MVEQATKRGGLKEKIISALQAFDRIFPYAIVGSGVAAVQRPELWGLIQGLLAAYIVAKGVLAGLEGDKEKKEMARKIAKDTEEALQRLGVDRETLQRLEREVLGQEKH